VDLYDEFRALIEGLNRSHVDYAVCGGIALAVHGHARFTFDIDLLIRPEDLQPTIDVARGCGFLDESGKIPLGTSVAYRIVKVAGADHLVLDLILVDPSLQIVWETRTDYQWQNLVLRVVSAAGLATMKRQSGRAQDSLDLKMLDADSPGDDHRCPE